MARGYYEMPQGKSRPVYGPPRPRRSPSNSPTSDDSLRSAFPPPRLNQAAPGLNSRRIRIVVLGSVPPLKMLDDNISAQFSRQATFEVANSIREGQTMLDQQPDIVLTPSSNEERAVWSALSSSIITYINKGGRVVTQLSQLQQLLMEPLDSCLPVINPI